ncbi:MAG: hypothetical protein U1C53_00545 [Candidatus Veblenbacteria bacterium]|nr:hypothetical protein [Candidatus Veblenbacteria bacterium]MDZ4229609.1 hypothetical protein [Candidatus Veblenbacteria bacterium]
MFENVNNQVTRRLQQDMNSGPAPVVTESAPPSRVEPAPVLAAEPAPPPTATHASSEPAAFVPEVFTAPVSLATSMKGYGGVAWLALAATVPSVVFWLSSALYVAGFRGLLLVLVAAVPFILVVVLNVLLPLAAVALALFVLVRTEADAPGRGVAKITLLFSGACLLALGWWLAVEAF